jgi:hypothetical protein
MHTDGKYFRETTFILNKQLNGDGQSLASYL